MKYLPGINIKDVVVFVDERGSFAEVYREDWPDLLEGDKVVQVNRSVSYPGMIRAWHRHERGQKDYFFVASGAMKICAYDGDEKSQTARHLTEIVLSSDRPQLARIPGQYWHGTKAVDNTAPTVLIYFVTHLYDYRSPDELRKPWNDTTIIPVAINGNPNDPRTNKPFDWEYPPHK